MRDDDCLLYCFISSRGRIGIGFEMSQPPTAPDGTSENVEAKAAVVPQEATAVGAPNPPVDAKPVATNEAAAVVPPPAPAEAAAVAPTTSTQGVAGTAAVAPEPPAAVTVGAESGGPKPSEKEDLPEDAVQRYVNAISEAEATLPVRITARPEGFCFEQMIAPKAPAIVLYTRLEKHLHIERKNARLYWEGRPLTDMDVIADACVMPPDGHPLQLELEFDATPAHLAILSPGELAVHAVDVKVEYGDDIPSKRFFVTICKGYDRKPFLGGFRNKKSQATYHNATTQTQVERAVKYDFTNKVTRTTQTQGVTRSCQTRRECFTQMSRPDLVVSETYDRVVVAKPYFSADKLIALQIQKAVQLQAYVRGWRARKRAQKLREERDDEALAIWTEDQRRKQEHEQKKLQEIDRRTHPRTAKDFAVLYNELEAWRLQEVRRIEEADISQKEKQVALQELLKKETKLLQTVDRLQIQASRENKVRNINTLLNKMSSAKSWGTKSAVNVETPFTIRARELRDLYNGLQLAGLTVDERLDILLHVKWTVKEFRCPLTRDIVELIDREADLLNRGRKDASLQALRKRMSNLFLQFIETPEFNPESVQYQRVPLEYTSRPLVKLDKK